MIMAVRRLCADSRRADCGAGGRRPSAEPPRGSITIERIADIKYPTNPAWSPDGTQVAFLWDAAGKQDLFVVTPGSAPVALTDFPVDPDLLQSRPRRVRLGVERRDPLRQGRPALDGVGAQRQGRRACRRRAGDAGAFALSPDRPDDRVHPPRAALAWHVAARHASGS